MDQFNKEARRFRNSAAAISIEMEETKETFNKENSKISMAKMEITIDLTIITIMAIDNSLSIKMALDSTITMVAMAVAI